MYTEVYEFPGALWCNVLAKCGGEGNYSAKPGVLLFVGTPLACTEAERDLKTNGVNHLMWLYDIAQGWLDSM